MNLPLYQYSKELKCWIWLSNVIIHGTVEMYSFLKGSFGYVFWKAGLYKTGIDANFMDKVKTMQILFL